METPHKFPAYMGISVFEVAQVELQGNFYRVCGLTWNTASFVQQHVTTNKNTKILPLNNLSAEIIKSALKNVEEVYISKDWNNDGNREVLPVHITTKSLSDFNNPTKDNPNLYPELDEISKLHATRRIGKRIVTQIINPHVAQVSACSIYNFTVLNNEFLLKGYVFNEETEALTTMKIMDDAQTLLMSEEANEEELGTDILNKLEIYLDSKEELSRVAYARNLMEEANQAIDKINSIEELNEYITNFQEKVMGLNNLA